MGFFSVSIFYPLMLELVIVNGHARGIIVRNLITGEFESHSADAVIFATGGYGNVFY